MTVTAAQLDSHAASYTPDFVHFEENRIVHEAYGRRIAAAIGRRGAALALSLGIGHMEVARPIVELLRSGSLQRYVVVDAAAQFIDSFRRSLEPLPPGLDLVEAFFETYETTLRFDVIEAGWILEHVDDPALVLSRMRPLLANDGRMFVAVPNARSLHRVLGHEAGLLPDLYALSDADRALGHRRYFDVASLCALVGECGYRIVASDGLLLKPFTTSQMQQLGLPATVWSALQTVAAPYPEISNSFCLELALEP